MRGFWHGVWFGLGVLMILWLLDGCAPSPPTPYRDAPAYVYPEHSYLELSEYCVRGDVMDYSRLCKQFHLLHDRPE